jgi:hypothetical protein
MFRGTGRNEESRGCTATRLLLRLAHLPPRTSVRFAAQPDSCGQSISTAPASRILIGPCLTAHGSAVRSTDSAYRQTATYAGVERKERQAELVELGGTPGAPR